MPVLGCYSAQSKQQSGSVPCLVVAGEGSRHHPGHLRPAAGRRLPVRRHRRREDDPVREAGDPTTRKHAPSLTKGRLRAVGSTEAGGLPGEE